MRFFVMSCAIAGVAFGVYQSATHSALAALIFGVSIGVGCIALLEPRDGGER